MEAKTLNSADEKLPVKKLFPLGLQHVLAMYAGALAVPLIVGSAIGLTTQQIEYLIAADLFTCGVATFIQSFGLGKYVGIKLPVILGCSFVSVTPMIAIGKTEGLPVIYGAIICSGIFVILCSFFFGKILKFFPPIVTGSVITIVGLSLLPVGLDNAAGGYGPHYGDPKNLLLAAIVLISILLMNKYFKGFAQATSVLLGLILGTVIAACMGMVNLSNVGTAGWFRITTPFYFGLPQFKVGPILTMCLVSIVLMIEATGVFMGIGKICDKDLGAEEITRGLRGEGVAQILGGLFNSFPYSTFSQNVGLVALSGVKSRYVCVTSGIILMCLGVVPKIAAVATIIPTAVLGGATIAMFGMVAVTGIRILSEVDFLDNGNMLVVACSLAMGLSTKVSPNLYAKLPYLLKFILEDGIVAGSITAILLNLLFNFKKMVGNDKKSSEKETNAA